MDEVAQHRRYSECSYIGIGLVRLIPSLRVHLPDGGLNKCFSGCSRQKNTRKSISWSARAASRWILDKLKEDRVQKVLRVRASNGTLEGLGSRHHLVSNSIDPPLRKAQKTSTPWQAAACGRTISTSTTTKYRPGHTHDSVSRVMR